MDKQQKKQFSAEHLRYVKREKTKKWSILGCQIGLLVVLLVLWEVLTRIGVLDPFFFSSPSRICKTLQDLFLTNKIWVHTGITLLECVLGFVISMLLGIIIAIMLWWSESLRKILDPYVVVINSLPKIALGPILIVWVGAGMKSTIAMTVLISIVVTILSVLGGFLSCSSDKILLLRSMGANKWQILTKLILPYSIPHMISALKMSIGLSWVGAIMGEYMSSKAGLGYLIQYGGQVFKLDLVMTAIILLCVMATAMYLIVSVIEKYLKKKRSS